MNKIRRIDNDEMLSKKNNDERPEQFGNQDEREAKTDLGFCRDCLYRGFAEFI